MSNLAALHVRVARKVPEAEGICSFELVAAERQALPAFSAGSHIDVHLPGGLTRQYSLCNDPKESHRYVIAVLNEPASRGGSRAMHETVNEGHLLQISSPRNHFPLAHEARHSVFMAGGIGITPLLCMAERLTAAGASFELHYACRTPARAAFRQRIESSSFASRAHFHFDDGVPDQRLDVPALLAREREGMHLYVCGPKGFMDAVLGHARAAGWAPEQLHYEFFTAEPTATDADGAFEVQLASSGRVIGVKAQQTVVQALAEADVMVPVSCEQGVCGTCLTRVISGVPDHRDMFLTQEEHAANDQFMPCCSRAKSARLVLDL